MYTNLKYLAVSAKQVKKPKKHLPALFRKPSRIQDNNQSIALGAINEDIESNLRSQAEFKRESQ